MGIETTQIKPRARRVLAIATRVLTASFGGYALAVAGAFLLARGLPMSRAEATTAASMLAVLIMPAAAIWAVAASSAPRALGGLVAAIVSIGGIAWILGPHA